MAMTRKALKAMGMTEEQVDSIIEMHTESMNVLREQINTLKADADKVPALEKKLKEMESGEDYKAMYEAEKTAHDKTKSEHAAKETAATNERLFRAELTKVGITGKRADQIVKLTDMAAFKVKNGEYEDAAAVEKHIRDEYSEFVPATKTEGANVPTPPNNSGGKMTRDQIAAIKDPVERKAAIVANMDAFERSN